MTSLEHIALIRADEMTANVFGSTPDADESNDDGDGEGRTNRDKVAAVVQAAGRPMSPKEIAMKCGMLKSITHHAIRDALLAGQLVKTRHRYARGDAPVRRGPAETVLERVVAEVQGHRGPVAVSALESKLDEKPGVVMQMCSRAVRRGLLRRVGRGQYQRKEET